MKPVYAELCQAARRLGGQRASEEYERRVRRFLGALREQWARGDVEWAEYLTLIEMVRPSSPSTAELPTYQPDVHADSGAVSYDSARPC